MAYKHPKFFQDELITWTKTFYSDQAETTPVDPASVVFKIKSPSGVTSTPSVVNEAPVGQFSASKAVDEYGKWEWRWITTNPVFVDQGTIEVLPRNVN